jgi:hypothetical protein
MFTEWMFVTHIRIIIKKAGDVLRPLIPQLQISFCKALVDPSSQVRITACNGILALSSLQVLKKETLIMELWQMIHLHTVCVVHNNPCMVDVFFLLRMNLF